MPEIAEVLERTTPRRPLAFDVADLARRGRRRRVRTQVGTGMGAVALVATAVTGLGLVGAGDQGEGQVVATRPPVGEVAQAFAASDVPLGTWEQVADPPFSPRTGSFTATASGGRVVVWGGSDGTGGGGTEGGGVLTDGGIYNPESEEWETVPPAPVPAGMSFPWRQLAGDRLMVLGSPDGAELVGAVYDLGSDEWTEIDPPPTIELPAEGIAWTGDTLVLVRFWSGASETEDARYGEPVVERWSFETGEWTQGATPPLANRFGPAVAFDGERLGVWGGARQEVEIGGRASGSELVSDGAIYDVAADRWEPMASGPLQPMMQGTAMWLQGGFAVAGGVIEVAKDSTPMGSSITGNTVKEVYDAAIYDPEARSWTALPNPLAETDGNDERQHSFGVADARSQVPLLFDELPQSGPHPVQFYDEVTRSWVKAPLRNLHTLDGTLVATSRTPDNPDDEPFEVQVLAGSVWEPATEAPFVNRMDAGVAVTGTDLLVVGGAEGSDLEVTGDAWLLRFDAAPND